MASIVLLSSPSIFLTCNTAVHQIKPLKNLRCSQHYPRSFIKIAQSFTCCVSQHKFRIIYSEQSMSTSDSMITIESNWMTLIASSNCYFIGILIPFSLAVLITERILVPKIHLASSHAQCGVKTRHKTHQLKAVYWWAQAIKNATIHFVSHK